MPQYICKLPLQDALEPRYLIWSTVVDAPVTCGMTRSQLDDFMRHEHGDTYMENSHPHRMERVEKNGTSNLLGDGSFESLVAHNRAGEYESEITLEEIIAIYAYPPKAAT
jgi:hypothetical protein